LPKQIDWQHWHVLATFGMYWLTGNIDMYACPLLRKVALCGLVMQACQEKFVLTFVWVIG